MKLLVHEVGLVMQIPINLKGITVENVAKDALFFGTFNGQDFLTYVKTKIITLARSCFSKFQHRVEVRKIDRISVTVWFREKQAYSSVESWTK